LTDEEKKLIANPPLNLSIPLEQLIENSVRTRFNKSTKASLLYYQNYAATIQTTRYKDISKEAAKRWMYENVPVRNFFLVLAGIKSRYAVMLASMERDSKYENLRFC